MREQKQGQDDGCYISGFEDGGGAPWAKKCGQSLEPERGEETIFPIEPLENQMQPCWQLDFNPMKPMLDL